jgi:hypothetical protein
MKFSLKGQASARLTPALATDTKPAFAQVQRSAIDESADDSRSFSASGHRLLAAAGTYGERRKWRD